MKCICSSMWSGTLNREFPFRVYGTAGRPVLVFPTQDGHCHDFDDNGMTDAVGAFLEQGRIQLFCVDSVDAESWSDRAGDEARRAWIQECWFRHCTLEFLPGMMEMNGTGMLPLATGCSMGATHALNTFLRRPDFFSGVVALSGAYDAGYFFGGYMDSNLYDNSIVHYMEGMPADHFYIPMYNRKAIVLCSGQGAWEDEMVRTTSMVRDIFKRKGIGAWIDFWGRDVNHDWPWWRKQLPYFLDHVLDGLHDD